MCSILRSFGFSSWNQPPSSSMTGQMMIMISVFGQQPPGTHTVLLTSHCEKPPLRPSARQYSSSEKRYESRYLAYDRCLFTQKYFIACHIQLELSSHQSIYWALAVLLKKDGRKAACFSYYSSLEQNTDVKLFCNECVSSSLYQLVNRLQIRFVAFGATP